MKEIYENTNDVGRSIAYWKAVTFIKGLNKWIETEEDIKSLPHIGEKIREKIKEILVSGELQKVKTLKDDTKIKALETLSKVHGIGPKTALKFIS